MANHIFAFWTREWQVKLVPSEQEFVICSMKYSTNSLENPRTKTESKKWKMVNTGSFFPAFESLFSFPITTAWNYGHSTNLNLICLPCCCHSVINVTLINFFFHIFLPLKSCWFLPKCSSYLNEAAGGKHRSFIQLWPICSDMCLPLSFVSNVSSAVTRLSLFSSCHMTT